MLRYLRNPTGRAGVRLRHPPAAIYGDRPMYRPTSAADPGITRNRSEVRTMDPLMIELHAQVRARDERLASGGLIPEPRRWRSSLEIMRDVRRRREQARAAA